MNKQYITGFGQISNLGLNSAEALKRLQTPDESCILKLPKNHLDTDGFYGSPLEVVQLESIESPSGLKYHRNNKLVTLCVDEALEKANIGVEDLKSKKVGICLGTTSADLAADTEFTKKYHRQEAEDFKSLSDSIANEVTSALATHYSLKGPLVSINNACTSGADVIGMAQSWIRQGLCEIVIAVGIDCILEDIYYGFRSLGLMSSEFAKPFDKNREGLVLGEGCGVVIVESGESVQLRKAKPQCELLGYGTATDSYHPTSPHPKALGLDLALEQALFSAKISKDKIDLINAHATGTQANDLVEGQFLSKNFVDVPVFATKAYTGHTLGAAGLLEAIWGIFCIQNDFIPATLGHEEVDPEIGLIPNRKVCDHKTSVYLSTSLGFGGSNAALLLGEV